MFKVGDKVICIDNTDREDELVIDGVYTVSYTSFARITGGHLVQLKECVDMTSFFEARFKPYNYRKEKLEKILYV